MVSDGGWVNVIVEAAELPHSSETVTVCTPAQRPVAAAVVCPLSQRYVNDDKQLSVAFTVALPSQPPWQRMLNPPLKVGEVRVEITGDALSLTVMVCVLVTEVLPHASMAFHVFVREQPVVTSLSNWIVAVPHPSVAVGSVNCGIGEHSMVISGPAWLIVGASESITVMVCETVLEVLPQKSIAHHVFVRV